MSEQIKEDFEDQALDIIATEAARIIESIQKLDSITMISIAEMVFGYTIVHCIEPEYQLQNIDDFAEYFKSFIKKTANETNEKGKQDG